MSTNVQVRVITGEFEKKAMKTIASGKMRIGIEKEEANGHVFNVGTGVATDVLTVARTLIEKYEIDVPVTISGNFRLGDIRHNYADITAARTILGFEPKWSFSDGIGEFVKWVNEQGVQEDKYEASIEEMKKKGLYK